jgi:hypothetical protein
MDAINIGGAVAGGIVQGQKINLENRAKEQDIAVKNYQLKELAQKEASDNRMMSIDTLFPNNKDMPETMKTMNTLFEAQGFKSQDVNGMKLYRQRDLKEFITMANIGTDYTGKQVDFRGKIMQATALDLTNNYSKISQMLTTKKHADGSNIKDDELMELQNKAKGLKAAIEGLATTVSSTEKLRVEAAKKEAAFAERTYWGEAPNGQQVNIDKAGRFWIGNQQMAQPPAGSTPKSVLTAQTPRQTTVIRMGGESKDNRTSVQKLWDGLSKSDKDKLNKKGITNPVELDIYMKKESKGSTTGVPMGDVDVIGG